MTPSHIAGALCVLAVGLTGCGESLQRSAEETVRQNLKDPESARFGEFYYNDKTKKACLTVNAKNSMGGYTGDQQALLLREKDKWIFSIFMEYGADFCHDYVGKGN